MADIIALVGVPVSPRRAEAEQRIRRALDAMGDEAELSGFVFMAWDKNISSVAFTAVHDGLLPAILVPDFVRNRLLAQQIEKWTIDTINERDENGKI